MKLNSLNQAIALLFTLALVSGCSSTSTTPEEPVSEPVKESQNTSSPSSSSSSSGTATTYSAKEEPQLTAEEVAAQNAKEAEMKAQAALREIRTFYFDFDQAIVKTESRAPLMAHAAFLAANPSVKVRVEGHCDERGTKEYNIALGERRAKAVERFLVINGVSSAQIEVISFGEERPVDIGHTEASWAKNRRAYIEYR
jgi:peptidoglycan-associated lipoprotein